MIAGDAGSYINASNRDHFLKISCHKLQYSRPGGLLLNQLDKRVRKIWTGLLLDMVWIVRRKQNPPKCGPIYRNNRTQFPESKGFLLTAQVCLVCNFYFRYIFNFISKLFWCFYLNKNTLQDNCSNWRFIPSTWTISRLIPFYFCTVSSSRSHQTFFYNQSTFWRD